MSNWIRRWGPALLVMTGIFLVSTRAKGQLPDFGDYDWPTKKLAHLMEYGLLAAMYWRGLTFGHGLAARRPAAWPPLLLAWGLAAVYGATDEFHQLFVPGRGANALDVLIDGLGAALGLSAYALFKLKLRQIVFTPLAD